MTITPDFTSNDLLEEIRAAVPQMGDDFVTTAEIAKELGVSPKVARTRMKKILDSLVIGKKEIIAMNQVKTLVSAYKIKEKTNESATEI